MDNWNIDVAVLIIFFNRPKQLAQVFNEVKKAKPRVLLLYQDGARQGNDQDIKGMELCRRIVDAVDWDCEIHKYYQAENYGCDPSEYIAQKWAFSLVDKCIILEDDDVPAQKFFYFCKTMLDRYENDPRVNIISGQNVLGEYHIKEGDYFFSRICAIWGWATWKRVIDQWETDYSRFFGKKYECLKKDNRLNGHFKITVKSAREHKKSGIEHYETLVSTTMYCQDSFNIVPVQNLITNIGIAKESTHSTSDIRNLPHGIRSVFNMKRFDNEQNEFVGPSEITEEVEYRTKVCRLMGWGHPLVNIWRKIESVMLVTYYSGIKTTIKKIRKHIGR